MFARFLFVSAITFSFSAAALADCGPCQPGPQSWGAHSVDIERGVTVMRGNIPNINNPRAALAQDRRAAEKKLEAVNLRALRAERAANKARAELAARRAQPLYYGKRRGYHPRYNSGNYRFGASVSRARFGGRARGFGGRRGIRGNKGVSRPVFSRRIRG